MIDWPNIVLFVNSKTGTQYKTKIDLLSDLYHNKGQSLNQISLYIGVCVSTIRRGLKKAGHKLRSRGGSNSQGMRYEDTVGCKIEALGKEAETMTNEAIAERVGCAKNTVSHWMKKLKIPRLGVDNERYTKRVFIDWPEIYRKMGFLTDEDFRKWVANLRRKETLWKDIGKMLGGVHKNTTRDKYMRTCKK